MKLKISLAKRDCEELKFLRRPIKSVICVEDQSPEFVIALACLLAYKSSQLELEDELLLKDLEELDNINEVYKKVEEGLANEKDFIKLVEKELFFINSQITEPLKEGLDLNVWRKAADTLKLTITVYETGGRKTVYKGSSKEIAIFILNPTTYYILHIDCKTQLQQNKLKAIRIAIQNLTTALKSPNIETTNWFIHRWKELATIFSKQEEFKEDINEAKRFIESRYKPWRYVSNIKHKKENECDVIKGTLRCGHEYELPEIMLEYSIQVMCSSCNYVATDNEIEAILKKTKIVCINKKPMIRCMFCEESQNIIKIHNDHYICNTHFNKLNEKGIVKCPANNCLYRFARNSKKEDELFKEYQGTLNLTSSTLT